MLVALVAEFLRVLNALKEVEQVSNLHQDIKGQAKGLPTERERGDSFQLTKHHTKQKERQCLVEGGQTNPKYACVCVVHCWWLS